MCTETISELVATAHWLRESTSRLSFGPPVTHVYSPLEYAWAPHRRFLELYGGSGARTLLLGMNPGPFGMAQTGVPFGDVTMVREWLDIEEPVDRPRREHPKRPVLGFSCPRREVSGQRFWGWARDTFTTPRAFFEKYFVWNYCPLAFMTASGRNRTPDKLPVGERTPLFAVCDAALRRVAAALRLARIVGIGRLAYERAAALESSAIAVVRAPHPSPANPAANRGWAEQFQSVLG
jgi:single-strand selective monofunctional uracil DNA glycosylase